MNQSVRAPMDRQPRVLLVSDEPLVPTTRGGRVETVGELAGFVENGAPVVVVVPFDEGGGLIFDPARHANVLGVPIFGYRRPDKLVANIRRPWLPHVAASRVPGRRVLDELLRQISADGRPDAVICAHDYTVPAGRLIARHFNAQIIVRSHNDELHAIMGSARGADSWSRKLIQYTDALRFRLGRASMLRDVAAIALLSREDASGYRGASARMEVIGPVLSTSSSMPTRVATAAERDSERILFVGALDTPQTAHGLVWFADEVMPLIIEGNSGAKLRVVGRKAGAKLEAALRKHPYVDFRGEVAELRPELDAARIFVNPVHLGSGVNMKIGPPAEHGLPIVSTTFGTRGLPRLREGIVIGDSPSDFASGCLRLLSDDREWELRSESLLRGVRAYDSRHVASELGTLVRETIDERRPTRDYAVRQAR